MQVRHFCYCLTDWSGITPRQQDYDSTNMVKCLKGTTISGVASLKVGGVNLRLDENNRQDFLTHLWKAVGQSLERAVKSQVAIVPIPNSAGIVGAPASYRTFRYAQAIAASSSGKLIAVDGLRWKVGAEPAYKRKGLRTPEMRYDNLIVIECPKVPVILFDDTITSGSSFVAAYWRLDEAGNAPQGGYVIARRTTIQEPDMFKNEERELDTPPRPLSNSLAERLQSEMNLKLLSRASSIKTPQPAR
jgi:hypothetical protein